MTAAKGAVRGLSFAREETGACWQDVMSLARANHGETGVLTDAEFDPDIDRYLAMDKAGMLRLFVMRESGAIVGYALFSVMRHLDYPKTVWAYQNVLYVEPGHRGRPAVAFMLYVDDQLRLDPVDVIYRHVSPKVDYSHTLERMGYAKSETGFLKRVS